MKHTSRKMITCSLLVLLIALLPTTASAVPHHARPVSPNQATITKFSYPSSTLIYDHVLTFVIVITASGDSLNMPYDFVDPLSPDLEWYGFVGEAPTGFEWDAARHALVGTSTLEETFVFAFTARTKAIGDHDHYTVIENTAYLCPYGHSTSLNLCIPSNTVTHTARHPYRVMVPFSVRQYSEP